MSSYYFGDLLSEPGFMHGTSSRHDMPDAVISDPRLINNEQVRKTNDDHHRRFLNESGVEEQTLRVLKQIHSDRVFVVESEPLPENLEGDELITATPGQPIGVYTADCVPVILYDPKTHTTGVVHAGRAGTEKGIVPATIKRMVECFGVKTATLKVALGPSIGPCCYEVKEDCLATLKINFPGWRSWVQEHTEGKVLLDLWKANREQALEEGVSDSRIVLSGECTACHLDRWYSYRKEGQRAGRMLTFAMRCCR
jgi:YfiH family protein